MEPIVLDAGVDFGDGGSGGQPTLPQSFFMSTRTLPPPVPPTAPPGRRAGPPPPLPPIAVNWGAAGIPPAPLTDDDVPEPGTALALPIPPVQPAEIADLRAVFLNHFSIVALVQMLG
jgi:hypothetical protein